MRKVTRLPQPKSLEENAARWTKELMDEIARQGSYAKVDDSFKNKYRQDDVKDALEKMYNRHCCYCESIVGISTYGRIEHLKPKSNPQFYQYTFAWDNLHWSCEICNTSYKKTKWDFQNPVLDPAKDDINEFLDLNLATGKYEAIGNNERAQTTIEHTGMNRESFVKARRRIIIRFLKDYKTYKDCGKEKNFCDDIKLLKEDVDYPGVYEKLLNLVG